MPRSVSALLALAFLASSCSVRKYAINQLGNAVAGTGDTFASDPDPELVGSALPFTLKLIESLLAESPRHVGLLTAASQGFTQYSYVFVQEPADELADTDRAQSNTMKVRATKLFLRGRDFGFRGLDVKHPDFSARIKTDPKKAVADLNKSDAALMYWTVLGWGGAVSVSRDFAMLPDLPRIEAIAQRLLDVDETYNEGAIHGFLIQYEMARLQPKPDRIAICKAHFERNLELAMGHQAAPYVTYAENVMVAQKDKAQFQELLQKAIKVDVNQWPEHRQLNLVMQRRARWLLSRTDKLFPPPKT
jgi:TRAP transporter T-component